MSELLKQKKVKDLFKKLNDFYKKDDGIKIKEWLNGLKTYDIIDGTIPGLLNNNKIQIETVSQNGTYNIILLWISNNFDKFENFDFDNVPPSYVDGLDNIDLSAALSATLPTPSIIDVNRIKKTFKTEEDIKKWFSNPETDPITGAKMSPMSIEYENIYEKAYKIMKNKPKNQIYDTFPKNHVLFGNIDLLFYTYVSDAIPRNINNSDILKNYNNYMAYDNICKLLSDGVENTKSTDNIFDTEFELLKNRFGMRANSEKCTYIKYIIQNHISRMVLKVVDKNIDIYTVNMDEIIDNRGECEAKSIIYFLENNKMSNGMKIIDFLYDAKNENNSEAWKNRIRPELFWLERIIKLYDSYIKTYNDIKNLFDPTSGIIENINNKKFNIIDDPLDNYFKKYEDALKKIKSPKFSKLLDLTTFKKIDTKVFLNDQQLKNFKNEKSKIEEDYIALKKIYEDSIAKYNITPVASRGKSPSPPKRPIIKLENGTVYQYGTRDPVHIKDSLLVEFNAEYKKTEHLINEYNKIKNMSYLELIKYETKKSPSKKIKDLSKQNILFSMNRDKINNDILYDYSELNDKCNEQKDILSNEDFDDENYPLAKLQLMVRLKIFDKDKTKYKTECIYAPKLYNYFVNSINNKTPFINPITRAIYTEENINDLMNVMNIVIPDIERPVFLKPIHDTKLIIDYTPISNSGYNWYEIKIYRDFGDKIYQIFGLCVIPADIESSGNYATESTDLTSSVMLFRIFKLFNDGRLLNKYIPPYYDIDTGRYVKLMIHFNRYKKIDNWLFDPETGSRRNKDDIIKMFKHYAEEINSFIY